MKFLVINPSERRARIEDHPDLNTAMASVGLKPAETDHANLGGGVGMMVYEFGLFKAPVTTSYFIFQVEGRTPDLYEGSAVAYAYDRTGETVDFSREVPLIAFMTGSEAIAYVDSGMVRRPTMAVDGKVVWQWPAPQPGRD